MLKMTIIALSYQKLLLPTNGNAYILLAQLYASN